MKKLLVVSILTLGIGASAYAQGGHHTVNEVHHVGNGMHHNEYIQNCNTTTGKNRVNLMKGNKEYQNFGIQIEEQKLLLKKEMMKENPDFKVVEEINNKIADLQSKRKTMRMKARYDYNKENYKTTK